MVEITIPVLNEEATLEAQIRKTFDFIQKELSDLHPIKLVLADNGSNDRTEQISRKLSAELGIRYIRLEQRGVGRALKASWNSSEAEIVGYMDLDLATDLNYLRPAFEILRANKFSIVTGSRLAKGSKVVGRSLLRSFTSRVFNFLISSYFKTSFSDGMCGFKFLKREVLHELYEAGAESDGWFFATELLVTAEYKNLNIYDLPVVWTDDPNSKVKIIKLAIDYIKAMRSLRTKLCIRGLKK